MRILGGVILGVLLVHPGIVLLRWLTVYAFGAEALKPADGCLVMIVILLSVQLVCQAGGSRRPRRHSSESHEEAGQAQDYPTRANLKYLPGERVEQDLQKLHERLQRVPRREQSPRQPRPKSEAHPERPTRQSSASRERQPRPASSPQREARPTREPRRQPSDSPERRQPPARRRPPGRD